MFFFDSSYSKQNFFRFKMFIVTITITLTVIVIVIVSVIVIIIIIIVDKNLPSILLASKEMFW